MTAAYRRAFVSSLAIVVAASAALAGPLQPISQKRSVIASANARDASGQDSDFDRREAPAFDPFVQKIGVSAEVPLAASDATASQMSVLAPFGFSIAGELAAEAVSLVEPPGETGLADAHATSIFEVSFEWVFGGVPCGGPVLFLEGDIEGTGLDLIVELAGPGGTVVEVESPGSFGEVFNPPNGVYTLRVNVAADASASDGETATSGGTFSVLLSVLAPPPPLPCDWDRSDCAINSNDFFAFLADYFEPGGFKADYNADGRVNSDDFFAFLDCYFNN